MKPSPRKIRWARTLATPGFFRDVSTPGIGDAQTSIEDAEKNQMAFEIVPSPVTVGNPLARLAGIVEMSLMRRIYSQAMQCDNSVPPEERVGNRSFTTSLAAVVVKRSFPNLDDNLARIECSYGCVPSNCARPCVSRAESARRPSSSTGGPAWWVRGPQIP